MYLSYFVLFALLFYNLYLKRGGKHARKAAPADDTLCGVDLKKGASGFFHGKLAARRRASETDSDSPSPPSPPKRVTRRSARR